MFVISLVDNHRQTFKPTSISGARETSRNPSFCAYAIVDPDQMPSSPTPQTPIDLRPIQS